MKHPPKDLRISANFYRQILRSDNRTITRMDIFTHNPEPRMRAASGASVRIRPRTLEEFVG